MSNPIRVRGLKATVNPTGLCWQLPLASLKDTSLCLLGWECESAPIDAGVPQVAAAVILSAILKQWSITFFDKVVSSPFIPFKKHYLLKQASTLENAMPIFETDEFNWTMQAQAGFLSPLNSPALNITIKDLDRVLNWRRSFDLAALKMNYGVTGLLLPAVDGDFGALSFFDSKAWDDFEKIIQQECTRNGIAWQTVPESDFKTTSWYP